MLRDWAEECDSGPGRCDDALAQVGFVEIIDNSRTNGRKAASLQTLPRTRLQRLVLCWVTLLELDLQLA